MDEPDRNARIEALALAGVAACAFAVLLAWGGSDRLWSWPGLVVMLPLVRRTSAAIRPPRFPWPAAPLAHLPMAMLFAAGALAISLALHKLMDADAPSKLAEVRVALIFYGVTVATLLAVRRLQR